MGDAWCAAWFRCGEWFGGRARISGDGREWVGAWLGAWLGGGGCARGSVAMMPFW